MKTEAHRDNIHLDTTMSVSLQSKDGKTPLHMTAIHGRFSRSQAIIENGKLTGVFLMLLSVIPANRFVDLFVGFVCLEGAEIDCEDKNGNTPLHIAARYGHELLINTLITNRADTAK